MTDRYQFKLTFEVRDYECDVQGIVNNAVYQHYLEHTRHVFLKQQGIDARIHTVGCIGHCYAEPYVIIDHPDSGFPPILYAEVNPGKARVEMDYLYPLRSGDQFYVGLNLERVSRVRFGFLQDIFRLPDGKPILKAKVIGTALNEVGRPCLPRELEELIARQIQTTISDKT